MLSTNQPFSTSRIVTQNLVISAAQAETDKEVWQSSVHDLSTLINLVALYSSLDYTTLSSVTAE